MTSAARDRAVLWKKRGSFCPRRAPRVERPAARAEVQLEVLAMPGEGRSTMATDAEIDALVYELYRLTGDEIAIVEGRA